MADKSHVILKGLNCFTDLFQGSNLPWTYAYYIWCDSDIPFLRGLHKKLVTVLYFSIINVFWLLNLCGAGGDASSAPQANLVITPCLSTTCLDLTNNIVFYKICLSKN